MAMAALKSEKTLSEYAQSFDVPITDGETQRRDRLAQVLGECTAKVAEPDIKTRHAKIAQWPLKNDSVAARVAIRSSSKGR
jgi:hypothetical protein